MYKELASVKNENNDNVRIISIFRIDPAEIIILFFVDSSHKLTTYFYDDDLTYLNKTEIYTLQNIHNGFGHFVRALYLKEYYAVFLYFENYHDLLSLKFRIVTYDNYAFTDKLTLDMNKIKLLEDPQYNELFKLDDNRLVYTAVGDADRHLYLYIFDLFEEYTAMKLRIYKMKFNDQYFDKETSVSYYNGYMTLTAVLVNETMSAMLMIFGFGNGTDFEIDISPYLMDTGYYNPTNNLYERLMLNLTIDNNIFGYERIEKIRLVSICPELLLYKGEYNKSQESTTFPIDDLFDANITLLQNRAIKKEENKLYTLEYQYLVKEPDYATFYDMPNEVIDIPDNYNAEQYYQRKTLDGRTNILKFKLCHNYCGTCIEYGLSNNDQRCDTCKEVYTYDYLAYMNRFTGNCVPKNQMYDVEEKELKNCEGSHYKYYYNTSRGGERYCFKYEYVCPWAYPTLNETTNECTNFTIPTTDKPSTILTNGPTTNIPTTNIPSTNIPSTNIPSTNIPSTNIPSTNIPSTNIPSTSQENVPSTTITSEPTVIPSTQRITSAPSTIFTHQCIYGNSITNTSLSNLTLEEAYQKARNDIVSTYCLNGTRVIIQGPKGYAFQVSSSSNELKYQEESLFTSIDLGYCENILREYYHIDNDISLIYLKFANLLNSEQSGLFQYEIFHPLTFEKLNLSLCDNTTYDVYVPIILDEKQEEIYNQLIDQGYNPLDLHDKFYREICTPYTSENGTDVLLDDREEFVYSSLVNQSLCPDGCGFTEYYLDKKYIKCECDYNNTDIVTLDLKHLSGKNAYKSLLSTLKTSNYKVMICYNLVFNFKIFCHNYGSIISLLLFIAYLLFMIYYAIKQISPLKLTISKILFEEKKEENITQNEIRRAKRSKSIKKQKPKIEEKEIYNDNNPPKRGVVRKTTVITTDPDNNQVHNTENYEFIDNRKPTRRKSRKKTRETRLDSFIVNDKVSEISSSLNKKNKEKLKTMKFDEKGGKNIYDQKPESGDKFKKENKEKINYNVHYDDYELNNMEYLEACNYDKRTCLRTYLSVLMREHSILYTFLACNDYNLFYIKIEKFFILLCTEMTMNGLFFVHESMHKKYTEGEDFTFVQKLPQLIFTILVGDLIDVILCFLSMTDKHVYEIKELSRKQREKKYNEKNKIKTKADNTDIYKKEFGEQLLDILDKMKQKIIGFFIVTFLLFLFYWYFISAFCAVYQNTQLIFLRDTGISFLTSLIEPFIIYGFTSILRAISLAFVCRKKLGCVYKLSDLIPIF